MKTALGKSEYSSLHIWLRKNYGNADHCEHCNMKKKKYDWALKHGFDYDYNKNNFIRLMAMLKILIVSPLLERNTDIYNQLYQCV
jgi:hypothetical protein